jgi:hypothetical protein
MMTSLEILCHICGCEQCKEKAPCSNIVDIFSKNTEELETCGRPRETPDDEAPFYRRVETCVKVVHGFCKPYLPFKEMKDTRILNGKAMVLLEQHCKFMQEFDAIVEETDDRIRCLKKRLAAQLEDIQRRLEKEPLLLQGKTQQAEFAHNHELNQLYDEHTMKIDAVETELENFVKEM